MRFRAKTAGIREKDDSEYAERSTVAALEWQETYRSSFLFVPSEEQETLSSVMRISKGPAVTGKPGDCGYDSKCKRTAEKVAVRRRYDGTPARTGEY